MSSLDCLLRPRSVAVVGASRKRGTIAAEVFHNLLHSGFTGAVYPVNPHAAVVQAVKAYRTVEEIPDEVDLAVLVVPATQVPEVLEACGRKGVRGAVVISAGFAETGAEGQALQERVIQILRHYGMRMVGPNCLGLLNADPEIRLNATFAPTFPPFGSISFASQSGALGLAVLDHARELGVGISSFVSIGNKADISGNDLLETWETDPATSVILLYLENLGDSDRFMEIARRVTRKKPIVMVKSGRTEAGARAASSHTGSLAGMDIAVDALLGQAGVIRVDTVDELFDVAMLLANQPVPRGNRIAILTNAGGPGIMASDACESHGLQVVALREKTQELLRAFLPPEASVKNPVDMIASASANSYEQALRTLLADSDVDAVLVLFVTPIVTGASDVAQAIVRGASSTDKTVAICFMGRHGVPEAVSELRERNYPSYAFPESAAAALARTARYGAWLATPEGKIPTFSVDSARTAAILQKDPSPRWLQPQEVQEILSSYGISILSTIEVNSAEQAAEEAARLTFPIAMKLASDTITHKTDVGGVLLGLSDPAQVIHAFRQIEENLTARGRRKEMRGVSLQHMVPPGIELFVGVTRDTTYGHLIGFGIGGIQVELWKDIVFRVAPLQDTEARAMLDQIRGKILLDGFRGGPIINRARLTDILLRISQLVSDFPEIYELDINPLMATSSECIAVDARMRVG